MKMTANESEFVDEIVNFLEQESHDVPPHNLGSGNGVKIITSASMTSRKNSPAMYGTWISRVDLNLL